MKPKAMRNRRAMLAKKVSEPKKTRQNEPRPLPSHIGTRFVEEECREHVEKEEEHKRSKPVSEPPVTQIRKPLAPPRPKWKSKSCKKVEPPFWNPDETPTQTPRQPIPVISQSMTRE